MKKPFLTLFVVATISMLVSCIDDYTNSNVDDINFNDSWLFIKADTNTASVIENSLLSGATVAGMQMVRLPHTPNIGLHDTSDLWEGICFYEKKFTVPAKLRGKMMSLRFEGAMDVADVWVNGKKTASHDAGFLPFVAKFTPQDGENVVIVKLDNRDDGDTPVGSNYTSFGGIYRNVWLCANDSLSFTDLSEDITQDGGISVTTSGIHDEDGTVTFTANIRNAYSAEKKASLVYRVLDHNRKLIGKGRLSIVLPPNTTEDFTDSLTLNNITLWNIDNPWLYTLEAKIVDDDNILDLQNIEFGFRTVSLASKGFKVNGKDITPLGVVRHQEYPYVGYAVSDQAQWRDAYKIKKAGFNFVRSCNGLQSESFLNACDHYGLMVFDNVVSPDMRRHVLLRDRNHACLLATDEQQSSVLSDRMMQTPVSATEAQQVQQTMAMAQSENFVMETSPMSSPCLSMFDYFDPETGHTDCRGLMSINRRAKFSYYFFQSQSEIDNSELKAFSDPTCFIASYWIPGVSKGVTVFSNCSEVELFVDGQSVGKQKPVADKSTSNMPHPYFYFDQNCEKPGTLRVIGYTDDEPLAECTIRTPLSPTRIKLVIDESGTLIAANDVVLVHCYILDKNNTVIPTADSEVEFSVRGTAELLSPAKVKAEAGVATALIRTGNSSNDFTISAKCGQMYTVADK